MSGVAASGPSDTSRGEQLPVELPHDGQHRPDARRSVTRRTVSACAGNMSVAEAWAKLPRPPPPAHRVERTRSCPRGAGKCGDAPPDIKSSGKPLTN